MKTIEVDEDLYRFIASRTQHIGESASDILRRLLALTPEAVATQLTTAPQVAPNMSMSEPVTGECQPDALEQLLAQAEHEGALVGVMFLDLDHFKTINDTLGHGQGDALLIQLASLR